MNKTFFIIISLLLFSGFIFVAEAQITEVETIFSEKFENPVGMEYSHEGSRLMYIVRKDGYVDVKDLDNPDVPSSNFIDISERVTGHFGELGLLGLAFSPDYPEDETFYLYYTFRDSEGERNYYSTLARFKAPGGVADPDSEERLFELLQPQDNHNGGQIVFGSDGYLYIALGDGGRDSRELAQNTKVLNGSILRIDVSSDTGYDIPPDNPFVGDPAGLDEIYAWGLRNPWRISFDPVTGNLWAADVGEKDREAIYIIEKGKNYGWPLIEGSVCFPVDSDCDKTGLELPVFEYQYGSDMGRSITGGFVGTWDCAMAGNPPLPTESIALRSFYCMSPPAEWRFIPLLSGGDRGRASSENAEVGLGLSCKTRGVKFIILSNFQKPDMKACLHVK
jgi:hypothetical protein